MAKSKPEKSDLIPEEQLEKLGKRIKSLRIKKGYKSFEIFAYEHGFARAQYGRYEQGQDLRFSSLVKVINALGISLKEFFNEGFE